MSQGTTDPGASSRPLRPGGGGAGERGPPIARTHPRPGRRQPQCSEPNHRQGMVQLRPKAQPPPAHPGPPGQRGSPTPLHTQSPTDEQAAAPERHRATRAVPSPPHKGVGPKRPGPPVETGPFHRVGGSTQAPKAQTSRTTRALTLVTSRAQEARTSRQSPEYAALSLHEFPPNEAAHRTVTLPPQMTDAQASHDTSHSS